MEVFEFTFNFSLSYKCYRDHYTDKNYMFIGVHADIHYHFYLDHKTRKKWIVQLGKKNERAINHSQPNPNIHFHI